MSSEKVLSPLFDDSGSESSPSLLSEDELKPGEEKRGINDQIRVWEREKRRERGGERFLTGVIAVVLLGEGLQRGFSTGRTATPLRPSLSLPGDKKKRETCKGSMVSRLAGWKSPGKKILMQKR